MPRDLQKVHKSRQILISRQNSVCYGLEFSSKSKLFGEGTSCLCKTSASLLAALNIGRKKNTYYPLEYIFGAIIKVSVNYSSFIFSCPRCLSESWLSPEFLNFYHGDNETNRMIYKEEMPLGICCIHVINLSSFRFCLA